MTEPITYWENLLNKFYIKFFPMSIVNEYNKEISSKFFHSRGRREVFEKLGEIPRDMRSGEVEAHSILLPRINPIQP
jgi:hypothetical protein